MNEEGGEIGRGEGDRLGEIRWKEEEKSIV
jgi:hypothetical protein